MSTNISLHLGILGIVTQSNEVFEPTSIRTLDCQLQYSQARSFPPQDLWSVLECKSIDIPGLLSVNADIYELGKEAFLSALFSTVYLQYSQHACYLGIVLWLSNLNGRGSLKWKKKFTPSPQDIASSCFYHLMYLEVWDFLIT